MNHSSIKYIAVIAVFLIFQRGYSQCANQSNIYSFTYSGKTYEVVRENKTWANAASCAVQRGGMLVEINNQAEQDAIYNQLNGSAGINTNNTTAPDGGGGSYVWIGGNDLSTEGNWVWNGNNDASSTQFWLGDANGSPVGGLYNNWGDEPDDYMGQQDGLGLSLDGWPQGVASQWNDLNVSNTLYFVIEYPSNVGMNEEHGGDSFTVFPNPSTNRIQINGVETASNYKIFSSTGVLIQNDILLPKSIIDVGWLDQGMYFIQINNSKPLLFAKE